VGLRADKFLGLESDDEEIMLEEGSSARKQKRQWKEEPRTRYRAPSVGV
jgi:hypothetical protein